MVTKFSLGFLFSPDLMDVLLIKKERPDWQQGLYNGIGGKLEGKETFLEAMQREFLEEAGIWVGEWAKFCTLCGQDFECSCFTATKDFYDQFFMMTDEEPAVFNVEALGGVVPTVLWLVPLAKDFILRGGDFSAIVAYGELNFFK